MYRIYDDCIRRTKNFPNASAVVLVTCAAYSRCVFSLKQICFQTVHGQNDFRFTSLRTMNSYCIGQVLAGTLSPRIYFFRRFPRFHSSCQETKLVWNKLYYLFFYYYYIYFLLFKPTATTTTTMTTIITRHHNIVAISLSNIQPQPVTCYKNERRKLRVETIGRNKTYARARARPCVYFI